MSQSANQHPVVYVVAFDIIHEDSNRVDLDDVLTNDFNDSCHIEESVWLIETPQSVSAVKTKLMAHLNAGSDRLLISTIGRRVAAANLDNNGIKWLQRKGVTVV